MTVIEQQYILEKEKTPYCLITLIETKGSAPQDVGAKALITKDGLFAGTIGGGKVEAVAIEKAKEAIQEKLTSVQLIKWNLQKDIGMTCGGEVKFLFETFHQNDWNIVLFGAGHVAQALCYHLSALDCNLTVIDPRAEWLSKINNPDIKTIEIDPMEEYVTNIPDGSFVMTITKGHAFDGPILEALIKSEKQLPFIGAIGSIAKRNVLKKELTATGISEDDFNNIQIPLGEPIGNNSPNEIAMSIIASLLKVKDQYFQTAKRAE